MARLIAIDMQLAWRKPGDVLGAVAFFILIMLVLPMMVVDASSHLAPSLILPLLWVAMMLALLPALARLFADDWASGVWEAVRASTYPLTAIITARLMAAGIVLLLPVLAVSVVFALGFGIAAHTLPHLTLALAIGVLCLVLIGGMAASLSLGAQGSQMLVAIIILPLAVPVLIFGVGISINPSNSGGWQFLLAELLILLAIAPPITAAAIGFADE